MKRYLAALAAASVLGLGACSDTLGPGNASDQDRAELLAILDESGWFTDEFGDDGAVVDFSLGSGFDFGFGALLAEAQDEVPLVRLWGRRHGRPVARERTVTVEGDAAQVTWIVTFEGEFVLDRTDDGQINPTSKPLAHQAVQHAVFTRRAELDDQGRRWQLVGVSPREWRMTDPHERTITLTRVEISINGGERRIVIEDPAALLDIGGRLPHLEVGDEVRVAARVVNQSDLGNTPPEFVFLHLFHANPSRRAWIRVRMFRNDAGEYARKWTVRHPGRGRIVVDAIDSQAFNTDSDDDYRAHLIGIPYRVGSDSESDGGGE